MGTYTPATMDDAIELTRNIRALDRAEIYALSRRDAASAIRKSLEKSELCWTYRDDDGVLGCIFGFAELAPIGNSASPWLLGTPTLKEHRKELVKVSRHVVHDLLKTRYDHMWNVVWAENKPSILYLSAIGFKIGDRRKTFTGEYYHPFSLTREMIDV